MSIVSQAQHQNSYLKPIVSCRDIDAQQWVVCPFAGGSSSAFRSWQSLTDITAYLAIYPGRDHRIHDVLATELDELVHPLVQSILNHPHLVHQDYIFCGHSMGAQVAYEACQLLEQYGKAPQTLVLSACHAPHLRGRRLLSHLNDEDFLKELVNIGGCSPELASNEALLAIFLPMLRADFRATEQYIRPLASNTQSLTTPVILAYGKEDDEAYKDEVDAWQQWIPHDQVNSLAVSGGHFYLTESPKKFIQHIHNLVDKISTSSVF